MNHRDRFQMSFEPERFRRRILGHDVIVHCHHYNARLQRAVQEASAIDGASLVASTAEATFTSIVKAAVDGTASREEGLAAAAELYSHLGFGQIDTSEIARGSVTATESHYVEGYRAGFAERDKPVCTLTSGYVRAMMHALTGEAPHVREVECMITGAKACRFEVDPKRSSALHEAPKTTPAARPKPEVSSIRSATVNEHAIIEAVTGMPVFGAENGLIPAFNVYLANMPADFYNLLAIRFVEEMQKHGQGDVAAKQLVYVAETCGLNTFRGILDSPEWEALIAPMVKQPSDVLFGIIAVSNALGWGHWRVTKHESRDAVTLVSYDGYEADGMLEYRGGSASPSCHMLSGVATGIMELVYGSGSLKERFGQYAGREHACRASKSHVCEFHVESCEE